MLRPRKNQQVGPIHPPILFDTSTPGFSFVSRFLKTHLVGRIVHLCKDEKKVSSNPLRGQSHTRARAHLSFQHRHEEKKAQCASRLVSTKASY